MDELEKQKALDNVKAIAQKEAKDFVEAALKKAKEEGEAEIKAMKDEAAKAVKELTDKLAETQKHADALDVRLQKGEGQSKKGADSYFGDNLEKALKENEATLAVLAKEKKDGVSFEIKAATTFTIGASYTGGTYDLTSWDPEFARIQRRKPFIRQLVRTVPTSKMYIAWAEETNPQGAVAPTAEGGAKPLISFQVIERTAKVEKIPAIFKVSRESLSDIPYLQSQINQELVELINLNLDTQILSGNGTSPNLKGILNFAIPAFAVPTGTQHTPNANNYDVIMLAVTQVTIANFQPNYVIVNPIDKANMQLAKDQYGRYVMPPFTTVNGLEVAGVTVIENNGVVAGSFLVGDFSKSTVAMREEIGIQIGYENDDFTKNLITILAEVRAVQYIKTNHLGAFVYGTFSTAITAINAIT